MSKHRQCTISCIHFLADRRVTIIEVFVLYWVGSAGRAHVFRLETPSA